jgi:heme exporter protein A
MTSQMAVQLTGVARRFSRRWVLRGADLRVERGEALALMGRNGSGKTTLVRVIATLLRPTRGSGTVFGFDLMREAAAIREHVGVLGHHSGLYEDLTAAENLRFSLEMAGLPNDRSQIERVLEEVGLKHEHNERVRGFSAGMRRRLALGRLLLRRPQLLLLDEPYAAFDPPGVVLINRFVREVAAAGGASIVVTHDYARAKPAVDRVSRITDGRIYEGLDATTSPDDQVLAAEDA